MKNINLSRNNLCIKKAILSQQTHATSTMSISYQGSNAPLKYGDRVEFTYRGVIVLIGTVRKVSNSIIGLKRETDVVINDDYDHLDSTPYLSSNSSLAIVNGSIPNIGAPQGVGGQGGVIKIADAVEGILSTARFNGVISFNYIIDIDKEALMSPFMISASTYGDLLRSILKWRPNSTTWFDYSGGTPVLHISDYEQLGILNISKEELAITDIKLEPRYDLVPPAVAFISCQANNWGGYVSAMCVAPKGASVHQPNVIAAQWDGDAIGRNEDPEVIEKKEEEDKNDETITPPKSFSSGKNEPYMVLRGRRLPSSDDLESCLIFWATSLSILMEFRDKIKFGKLTIKGEEGGVGCAAKNYDTKAIGYEFSEGAFNELTRIKHCMTTVRQAIQFSGKEVPSKLFKYFPFLRQDGTWWGYFWVTLRTINVSKKSFIENKNQDDLSDEDVRKIEEPTDEEDKEVIEKVTTSPPDSLFPIYYDEMAQHYYGATRHLPHDGTISIKGVPAFRVFGLKTNIKGLLPEWELMQSISSGVTIDYIRKSTQLRLGAPIHISLQDMASRAKALREQSNTTKVEQTPVAQNKDNKIPLVSNPINWGTENQPIKYQKTSNNRARGTTFYPLREGFTHSKINMAEKDYFSLACVTGDDGEIVSTLCANGLIRTTATGAQYMTKLEKSVNDYVFVGAGATSVYLVFSTNDNGGIVTSTIKLQTTPGVNKPYRWWSGYDDNSLHPRPNPYPVGHYSYEIGRVDNEGNIKQYQKGPIEVLFYGSKSHFPGVFV